MNLTQRVTEIGVSARPGINLSMLKGYKLPYIKDGLKFEWNDQMF